jgi:predicted RNA-binding protein
MHWVVVSNPGVIPYEFVDYWPFKNYDWPEWEETEELQKLYYLVTKERVKRFLQQHSDNYIKIVTFFKPDSLTFKAVKEAIEELNLEEKTVHGVNDELYKKLKETEKRPLFSKELLHDFKEKLKELQKELKSVLE